MNKERGLPHSLFIVNCSLFIILLLLFFSKMAFSNLILARGDTFLYFYPYWSAAADALQNGRLPLWNPDIFMGTPLLANSQMGFFYPLNWPFWLAFNTPVAVKASILLHLLIAGGGAYAAARRAMGVGRWGALLTVVFFALSPYLTAQVEHVNQLQGLAWLPWGIAIVASDGWSWRKQAVAIAAIFSLQLLAGHTQTAFISGVAMGVWNLFTPSRSLSLSKAEAGNGTRRFGFDKLNRRLFPLIAGGMMALLLTAVQLLPTLELTRFSSRQGGLTVNEVLSFSLPPTALTRALLPAWNQSLFSEYVAFFPLIILAFALTGAWRWKNSPANGTSVGVRPAIALVLLGLFLAFGAYNPANWLFAHLPSFNLFRVPARWLVLYTLGIALLAGRGWELIMNNELGITNNKRQANPHSLFIISLSAIALILWNTIVPHLPFPIPPEAPWEAASAGTMALWGAELLLIAVFIVGKGRIGTRFIRFTAVFAVFILFLATRSHPYNNLTAPEAYSDLRPSTTRLMAVADGNRLLSLSNIFFDTGDQAETDSIYADQLSPEALYDYTIAVKQKEIIAPNLPMVYGLPSVDGFDGGILPLRHYSEAMRLILPAGVVTTDGRLRENLPAIPAAKWLDLFNAGHLITDKTGDRWHDGVFYDLQHPAQLAAGETVAVGYLPAYEATELRLLASTAPAIVEITTTTGDQYAIAPEMIDDGVYAAVFPQPLTVQAATITAAAPVQIDGLSLRDERDESFQSLLLGNYRLIHSGDVKVYENSDVLPRAFMVYEWEWVDGVETAVSTMQSADFDPRKTAVFIGTGELSTEVDFPQNSVEISHDAPERVVVQVDSARAGYLLLTDANYAGWEVAVNGRFAEIIDADVLFRAVAVPAGTSEVVFTFVPSSFKLGLVVSGVMLLLLVFRTLGIWNKQRRPTS